MLLASLVCALASIAFCALIAAFAWIRAARLLDRYDRLAARVGAIVGGILLLAILLLLLVPATRGLGRRAGTWHCTLCGAMREEVRVLGRTTWSGPPKQGTARSAADFQAWHARTFGEGCGHTWTPVGCHSMPGGGVGCTMFYDRPYLYLVPRLEDERLARDLVTALAELQPRERAATLRRFEHELRDAAPRRDGEELPAEALRDASERVAGWLYRSDLGRHLDAGR